MPYSINSNYLPDNNGRRTAQNLDPTIQQGTGGGYQTALKMPGAAPASGGSADALKGGGSYLGQTGSSSGGSDATQNSVVDSGRTSPSDWVNLQRYFGLNSGAGQSMGQGLINNPKAGTVGGMGGLPGEVTLAQSEINAARNGSKMQSPSAWLDVQNAQNDVNRLGSFYGRQSILQGSAKGPYSQGDSTLDSFLSGAGTQDYVKSIGDLNAAFGLAQATGNAGKGPGSSGGGVGSTNIGGNSGSAAPGQVGGLNNQNQGQSDLAWAQSMGYTVNADGTVNVPQAGGGYKRESPADARAWYDSQYGGS